MKVKKFGKKSGLVGCKCAQDLRLRAGSVNHSLLSLFPIQNRAHIRLRIKYWGPNLLDQSHLSVWKFAIFVLYLEIRGAKKIKIS